MPGEPATVPLRSPAKDDEQSTQAGTDPSGDAVHAQLAELLGRRRPFFRWVALRTVRARLLADDVVQEAFRAGSSTPARPVARSSPGC